MDSFKIHLQWRAATVEENGPGYIYPAKFSRFFRDRYSCPAVYRWRVHPGEDGKPEPVYIGEAEVLVRRVQKVLTPPRTAKGGETNKRLREIFDRERAAGKSIFLDVADFEPFEINAVLFSREELGDRFKRRLLEDLSLCFAQALGHPLLNKVVDPVDKVVAKLKKLPPHLLRQVLQEAEERRKKLSK